MASPNRSGFSSKSLTRRIFVIDTLTGAVTSTGVVRDISLTSFSHDHQNYEIALAADEVPNDDSRHRPFIGIPY